MRKVDSINKPGESLLTAREALALLGVKPATLYAYVSRGLVRTAPAGDGRRRLYARDDIERLQARSQARRGHGVAAAGALRFGEPVLESAITEIENGELRYRGLSAVALATGRLPFENAAEFLWTGVLPDTPVRWEPAAAGTGKSSAAYADSTRLQWLAALRDSALKNADPTRPGPPLTASLMAFGVAGFALSQAGESSPLLDALLGRARQLISFLAGVGMQRGKSAGIAASLLRSLTPRRGRAAFDEDAAIRAVDCALILCADHELNASTFAARVAASTGADIYACFLAALGTLSGPRHGGACNEVEALLARLPPGGARLRDKLAAHLKGQEALPGFGHQLYPAGDPRAPPLLDLAWQIAPAHPERGKLDEVVQNVYELTGLRPSVDFGLVTLATALGLGAGGAMALFALGRAAGWTAHVIEQRQQNVLLRPRAKYVGR